MTSSQLPRWPMRKTLPATLDRPTPMDRLYFAYAVFTIWVLSMPCRAQLCQLQLELSRTGAQAHAGSQAASRRPASRHADARLSRTGILVNGCLAAPIPPAT